MPPAQLVLVVDAQTGEAVVDRTRAAVRAAPFASAVIRIDALTGPAAVAAVRPLVALLQAEGVAAVTMGDPAFARACGADGAHLAPLAGDPAAETAAARAALGKGMIVGVEITSGLRHDAMTAGEAGADYVAFSGAGAGPLITWWAEVFELPCVAMGDFGRGVTSVADTALLVAAGADFVAVALPVAQTAGDIQALMRAHVEAAASPAAAASRGSGSGALA